MLLVPLQLMNNYLFEKLPVNALIIDLEHCSSQVFVCLLYGVCLLVGLGVHELLFYIILNVIIG